MPAKIVIVVSALGLLVCAFALGRATAPEPDVVETVRVEYKERVVTVKEAAEVKRVVVWRDRITAKDGTVTERSVETTNVDTRTLENKKVELDGSSASDRIVSTPLWRAGVLVGAQVPTLTPVYGGIVERRIAGPFSVGAWGLSTGTAGLALTMEF